MWAKLVQFFWPKKEEMVEFVSGLELLRDGHLIVKTRRFHIINGIIKEVL